jgi:hypothetical protein
MESSNGNAHRCISRLEKEWGTERESHQRQSIVEGSCSIISRSVYSALESTTEKRVRVCILGICSSRKYRLYQWHLGSKWRPRCLSRYTQTRIYISVPGMLPSASPCVPTVKSFGNCNIPSLYPQGKCHSICMSSNIHIFAAITRWILGKATAYSLWCIPWDSAPSRGPCFKSAWVKLWGPGRRAFMSTMFLSPPGRTSTSS